MAREATAGMSSSKSRRQAAYRQRQALGATVLQVTVEHYAFVEALIAAERISITDALDRRQVTRAANDVLADFVKRWIIP